MELITVEKARQMRNAALEKKKTERFERAKKYDYFNTVMEEIAAAANSGKTKVELFPHDSDFYDKIIQSGKLVPADEKDFTNQQKEVFDALEDSLNYHVARESNCQVTFSRGVDRIDITISRYSIYW